MNWFLFASISIFSSAIANLLQKNAMKEEKSDPITYSIFFQFSLAIFTGLFALFKGFNSPPLHEFWLNFLVSAFLYGMGTLSLFKAVKALEASEVVIMAAFGAAATIISSFLFLAESLTILQVTGVFFVLSAIAIVNAKKQQIVLQKGTMYAILGTVCYGLAVTNDAFILKSYDAISYTPIMSFLPGVILIFFRPSSVKQLKKSFTYSSFKSLSLYGFFYSIQAVTYYLSLETGAKASQMAALFKSEIIITVILATIFLNERKSLMRKAIAVVVVTIGVFLLR
jgi:drug/metabolite transporter (DMT)-like permease